MKNLIFKRKLVWLYFLLIFINYNSYSQEVVTWNPFPINPNGISGATVSGITVTVESIGTGHNLEFWPIFPTEFQTRGPWPAQFINAPIDDVVFNFSEPVIITNLLIRDINSGIPTTLGFGDVGFNDSFLFSNNFNTFTPTTNPFVNNGGVNLPTGGEQPSQIDWLCSEPIQNNFSINFLSPNNITTAYLYYSLSVMRLPIIEAQCLNSIPVGLPLLVGNGITGNWFPEIIDTSVSGLFEYTFTPNAGQILTCPFTIEVVILHGNDPLCCQNTLTLINPLNNVATRITNNQQAEETIFATNIVNGNAIYHAGQFVELNEGFEANINSQFSAYIEGCSGNFAYRNNIVTSNPIIKNSFKSFSKKDVIDNMLKIYPNPSSDLINIETKNSEIKNLQVVSVDGRLIMSNQINQSFYQLDVTQFDNGIYILNIETSIGETISRKIIKK